MVAAAMRLLARLPFLPALLLAGALIGGCGSGSAGSSAPRSTAGADPQLEIVRASFPAHQAIARPVHLEIEVRNAGNAPLADIALAVHSFYYRSSYPKLADPSRPVWIVDEGPGAKPALPVATVPFDSPGGDVSDDRSVWIAGPLGAGQTRTLSWRLTPVLSGARTIAYALFAGRPGSAGLSAQGAPLRGSISVQIAPAPPTRYVNPETGAVEVGRLPVAPGP
jgi:hypothetical protein